MARGADPYRLAGRGALIGVAAFSAVIFAGPLESALVLVKLRWPQEVRSLDELALGSEVTKPQLAKGELDIPDVATASVQFFTLIKGEVHARMTCGLCSQPGPLDRRRHIDATVDMFLRAYGRR